MKATGITRELAKTALYSEELGIDLAARRDEEYFKWFLASVLFGARINETIARNTYRAFARHDLLSPERILRAGWDFLVNPIMREGGYVRYDGKTSSEILDNCRMLLADYGGSLSRLRDEAKDSADLERRLLAFRGIGPVTTNIFLRELRPYWAKADPAPLPAIQQIARNMKVDLGRVKHGTITFSRIEAGLVRAWHRRSRARGSAVADTGRR